MSTVDTRTTPRTDESDDHESWGIAATTKPDIPCRTGDPDLWFADSPERLERAKQLCARCPVRSWCLGEALDRAEPWGVWGGEIFEQGVVIARKRPRGRPRKTAAVA